MKNENAPGSPTLPVHPDNLQFLAMVPCPECKGFGCYSCSQAGTIKLTLSLPQVCRLIRAYIAHEDVSGIAATPTGDQPAPTAADIDAAGG